MLQTIQELLEKNREIEVYVDVDFKMDRTVRTMKVRINGKEIAVEEMVAGPEPRCTLYRVGWCKVSAEDDKVVLEYSPKCESVTGGMMYHPGTYKIAQNTLKDALDSLARFDG